MNILVTAGPTREPIDPVRFIGNRSSGKMGYEMASAFAREGHTVLLISGPTSLDVPDGVDFLPVESAHEMNEAVVNHLGRMQVAVFAAAVADYSPSMVLPQKIKKSSESISLELVRTTDILGSCRSKYGYSGTLVGFAAETENLIAHARDKLMRKECDLIIANDVSKPGVGFESDQNEVTLVYSERIEQLPLASKHDLAHQLVRAILMLHAEKASPVDFPTPMTDLALATEAALTAGKLLRQHFGSDAAVDEASQHDIKLALDKESQKLITSILLGARPGDALYGEEGIAGNQDSERQWIVDPIDGTVNFFYGIPHFCVSIALRVAGEIVVGVIHDPMVGETWTVEKGGAALLNGKPIQVSSRDRFEESMLFVGCGKDEAAKKTGIERFHRASLRARKMRMMGSAALGMAYIACGRLDAYIESRISLWDIAAGKLLVEMAGGKVDLTAVEGHADAWSIVASSGKLPLAEIL